ncbi:MAG: hypothetical protein Q9214_003019 [Letrouitia sp. 1 TL-2023]
MARLSLLALGVSLLTSSLVFGISPSDIPVDTPIASLISSAKDHLAQGNANDALTYFDVAAARDPHNYLTFFQRGATYLSLGRNAQASQDFDKVLAIRPGFERALIQRAKIKSKNADWVAAMQDYEAAGKLGSAEVSQLEEAERAARLAFDSEKAGDWEGCIGQAGTAIMVAGTALNLRQLRARCRFERGEVLEGTSDLAHVLQIAPESVEPHLQISSMMFYSVGDMEKGLTQIRKCLHSDPENKACSKMYRREKQIDKTMKQVSALKDKRQFNSAAKLLVGTGEEAGLIQNVKEEISLEKEAGHIHKNSPDDLYGSLVEMACEFYTEMNNKKKALPYCSEALKINSYSLFGLISQAQRQLEDEEFEAAVQTLDLAQEHHPSSSQIPPLLQKAQVQLKRSKTKDYYKVLGVSNDADDRAIKRAYRTLTKKYHPDKTAAQGVPKEDAEKKMASINEAYEVLSDPELRARFDRGDDPNDTEQQSQPFHGSPFGQGPGGQQFFFRQGSGGGGGFPGGFQFQQGGGGFQFPGGFGFP